MDNSDEIRNGDGSNGERKAFWIQGSKSKDTGKFWTQEDKYFTPSIEDIRVGYECELLVHEKDADKEDFWKTYTLNPFITKLQIDAMTTSGNWKDTIRVPYLTKEQIEAEGWEVTAENKDTNTMGFKKDKFSGVVTTHGVGAGMWITKSEGFKTIYSGECKDINTFRYICKLLGI
jgi:hypothetical protein